jgi:ABC-type glycerol-3-phosphate transport system substrate-binding protein
LNKRIFTLSFALLIFISALGIVSAQQTTVITITAPEWYGDIFEETIIPKFESEYPGIEVQFVYFNNDNNGYFIGMPSFEEDKLEAFFDDAEVYVSQADVVYMSSWSLNPILTRAGYLLDLTPLVTTDASLNADDFIPAALESVQWDGGTWALPVTARIELLVYNQDEFDKFGLAHPNENWTLTDLLYAADALTIFDEEGEVERLGFTGYNPATIIYGLTGENFYDETTFPAQPDFSSPELATLYQEWIEYTETHRFSGSQGYMINDIPMSIGEPYMLMGDQYQMGLEGTWGATLLPGGHAGINIEGYAVSSGTAYPEAAYEFLKFISNSPEYINYFGGGSSAARRSLIGVELEDSYYQMPSYPPEAQAIIDRGYENAVSASELLFGSFMMTTMRYITDDGMDMESAFEKLEQDINGMLTAAEGRRETTSIVVIAPEQDTLVEGEIVLNFGMNGMFGLSEQRTMWDSVVDEFVAANPAVGDVKIDSQMYGPEGMNEDIDCYYSEFQRLSNDEEQLSEYLTIDPFLSADPNFDTDAIIPLALEQVRRNNLTYGYPIDIQPSVLIYNADIFTEAGIPEPVNGWDVNTFNQALIAIKRIRENDPIFSTEQSFGNNYLLMLIAAYGGLPYDHRTDPPTLNLTDPQTIEATRQVAQLVHDGYIEYSELATFGGGYGGMMFDIPISTGTLSQNNFLLQQSGNGDFPQYRITTYPSGNTFVPVSFSVGAVYIMAETYNAQVCYDWINSLVNHPELFGGIPVNRTQFDNPAFVAAKGEDIIQFQEQFMNTLNAPNAIIFSGAFGGVISEIEGTWLEPSIFNLAFDDIMLNGVDVETALAEAQSNIEIYRECAAAIPKKESSELMLMSNEESMSYWRQFTDCAIALRPELSEAFSYYYQDE